MNELNFRGCKILIVGDLILDQYIQGNVNRISQEAPVPVVKVTNIAYSLGGAGNTLNNISHLKAGACIICIAGNDYGRQILENKLREIQAEYYLIDNLLLI